jgi:hypothetical protein
VVDWPAASSTRRLKLNVPAVVGVPVIRPGDACRARPGGSAPATSVHVYGVVPPSAKTPFAYAWPTVPGPSGPALVATSCRAGLMVIVNWRRAVFPSWSCACTVNVAACTVVGRPKM